MSFSDQPFSARLGRMGDEAELAFEAVWPRAWTRYGFNRPRCSMRDWSLQVRYTPDYMDSIGPIECQGYGRDRVLKIKCEKRVALTWWRDNLEPNLRFFIWDTTTQRWAAAEWQVVDDLLSTPFLTGTYPEGTPYRGLHFDQLANLKWNDKERT